MAGRASEAAGARAWPAPGGHAFPGADAAPQSWSLLSRVVLSCVTDFNCLRCLPVTFMFLERRSISHSLFPETTAAQNKKSCPSPHRHLVQPLQLSLCPISREEAGSIV